MIATDLLRGSKCRRMFAVIDAEYIHLTRLPRIMDNECFHDRRQINADYGRCDIAMRNIYGTSDRRAAETRDISGG